MSESDTEATVSPGNFDTTTQYTGRVKWFNNKAGYGFVTISHSVDGSKVGEDVFCHHSGVRVGEEQYKYLVQGEYVEFTLRASDNDSHPYQAANLTGMHGGKLMCETRNEQRQQRTQEENDGADGGSDRRPRKRNAHYSRERVRVQGTGPREGEVWTLVRESSGDRRNQRQRRQES